MATAASLAVTSVSAEGMAQDDLGGYVTIKGNLTGPSSYATGGIEVTAAAVETAAKSASFVVEIDSIKDAQSGTDTTGTYMTAWLNATGKVIAFDALGTEVTAEDDLSSVVIPITLFCKTGY